MLRGLTARQLLDWEAYNQVEPFGDERGDWHAAQVVQMLAAVNRTKNTKVPPLGDFVLKFAAEAKKRQTWQEQKMIAQMMHLLYTGDK